MTGTARHHHLLGVVASVLTLAGGALSQAAMAQTLDPLYAGSYSIQSLSAPPGVPPNLGGLTFKYDDPNTLLIGGTANAPVAAVYSIGLTRGCLGQIVGFTGVATQFCSAPRIDGGLIYGPSHVLLYVTYSDHLLGEVKIGSTAPDKIIDLATFGFHGSTGTLMQVPPGFGGAGSLKIISYSFGDSYTTTLLPDGSGTFDLAPLQAAPLLPFGIEGIVYIHAGNPQFAQDSALVSNYSTGQVVAYQIDSNGDPITATAQVFMTGLNGAEGAAIDPVTGDFLFSTFGGTGVIVVHGFVDHCPSDISPLGGNGVVDVNDLLGVIASWGQSCTPADIDKSGQVNVNDLLAVVTHWGPCT
jgi:hypothetical protein